MKIPVLTLDRDRTLVQDSITPYLPEMLLEKDIPGATFRLINAIAVEAAQAVVAKPTYGDGDADTSGTTFAVLFEKLEDMPEVAFISLDGPFFSKRKLIDAACTELERLDEPFLILALPHGDALALLEEVNETLIALHLDEAFQGGALEGLLEKLVAAMDLS